MDVFFYFDLGECSFMYSATSFFRSDLDIAANTPVGQDDGAERLSRREDDRYSLDVRGRQRVGRPERERLQNARVPDDSDDSGSGTPCQLNPSGM